MSTEPKGGYPDSDVNRDLRIALYHPRAAVGDGGITRSVQSLTREFDALGLKPRVIFDGDGTGPPAVPGEWVGIRHVDLGPLHMPRDLTRALSDIDVVILHSGWTMHNYVLARAAANASVPVVLAPRGAYDPQIVARRPVAKRVWLTLFERRLLDIASAVHAFFESQVSHAEALGFDGPALIAPNGVTVPDPESWDGGTSGEMVYVGRFDPEHKGLDLLVSAIEALTPGERPQLALHGPDWKGGKRRLADMVERKRLGRWISIRDAVYGEEKWEIMRTAQGFAYPSRWEAYGNAPAEAAAIGVPTLVTPYPLGEYLAHRQAAVLVQATAASIGEGLRTLGRPEAAQIGGNAAGVMKEFSWPHVARQWVDQLAQICDGSLVA